MKNRIIGSLVMVSVLVLIVGLASSCAAKVQMQKVGDLKIALSVKPDPPIAGKDLFRIKLTDSASKPITDAKVKVTAFMPPMAGMSAMTSETEAKITKDKVYEATAELAMGGTWQITVDISRPGKPKLSPKFSLTTGKKGVTFVSAGQSIKGKEKAAGMEHTGHTMETTPPAKEEKR